MRFILFNYFLFHVILATVSVNGFVDADWNSIVSLPSGFEPSGIAWHGRLERLIIVSDEGQIITCNIDGTDISYITNLLGHDLEGATVADANSNFVYVAIEDPPAIAEVDIEKSNVSRQFPLEQLMQNIELNSENLTSTNIPKKEKKKGKLKKKQNNKKTQKKKVGIEALAYVPNDLSMEGGYFYAGIQQSGIILVIELPIHSNPTSSSASIVKVLYPTPLRTDLSGMEYYDGYIYATYDTHDLLVAFKPDGSIVQEWKLPKDGQEGVVVVPISQHQVMLLFCQDSGKDSPSAIWSLKLPMKQLPSYPLCHGNPTVE